jgi:hypothetical protein
LHPTPLISTSPAAPAVDPQAVAGEGYLTRLAM